MGVNVKEAISAVQEMSYAGVDEQYKARVEACLERVRLLMPSTTFDISASTTHKEAKQSLARLREVIAKFLDAQTKLEDGKRIIKSKLIRTYNKALVRAVIKMSEALERGKVDKLAEAVVDVQLHAAEKKEKAFVDELLVNYGRKTESKAKKTGDDFSQVSEELISLIKDGTYTQQLRLFRLARDIERIRAQKVANILGIDGNIEYQHGFQADLESCSGRMHVPIILRYAESAYLGRGQCAGAIVQWMRELCESDSAFGFPASEVSYLETVGFDTDVFKSMPDLNNLMRLSDDIDLSHRMYNAMRTLEIDIPDKPLTQRERGECEQIIEECRQAQQIKLSEPRDGDTEDIKTFVKTLLEASNDLPIIIGLSGSEQYTGHAVGVRYIEMGNTCQVDYFDSRYGWVQFDNLDNFLSFFQRQFVTYQNELGYDRFEVRTLTEHPEAVAKVATKDTDRHVVDVAVSTETDLRSKARTALVNGQHQGAVMSIDVPDKSGDTTKSRQRRKSI